MKYFSRRTFWGGVSIAVVILLFFTFRGGRPPASETEETAPTASTETITLGQWSPEGALSALATVASDQEVQMVSEISGTVESITVAVGDSVRKGQSLLRFRRIDDQTSINYQNALQAFQTAQVASQASVDSAQIGLENAEADYYQTMAQEEQNFQKITETLATQTVNLETSFAQALNLMDKWLGVSRQYRHEVNPGRFAIGARNRIQRQDTWNDVQSLLRTFESLVPLIANADLRSILATAEDRVTFAKSVQKSFNEFELLSRGAVFNSDFGATELSTLLTEVTSIRSSLNAELLGLQTALEEARTAEERKALTILSAQNRFRNAEKSLTVAQGNADNQVTIAQNQVRLSQASAQDLVVRAPFAGVISEKQVNVGAQVSPGQSLFMLTNPDSSQKVVAFLTTAQYERLEAANEESPTTLNLQGQSIPLSLQGLSSRIDAQSQKRRVEFTLPQDLDPPLLVGDIGKIILPSASRKKLLLPLSALSFEPDGPEVLVVEEGIANRQKVQVGSIIGNAIEITTGLEEGQQVVRFRNRVHSGQRVSSDLDS